MKWLFGIVGFYICLHSLIIIFVHLPAHRSTAKMKEEVAEEETDKIEEGVEVEDLEHLEQKEAADEHHLKEEYSFLIFLLK